MNMLNKAIWFKHHQGQNQGESDSGRLIKHRVAHPMQLSHMLFEAQTV